MRLRGHIESVGKRRLDESGKYPVNENDEESLQILFFARLVLDMFHAQPGVADISPPVRKAASKLPSRLLPCRSDILSRV